RATILATNVTVPASRRRIAGGWRVLNAAFEVAGTGATGAEHERAHLDLAGGVRRIIPSAVVKHDIAKRNHLRQVLAARRQQRHQCHWSRCPLSELDNHSVTYKAHRLVGADELVVILPAPVAHVIPSPLVPKCKSAV